LNNVNFELGNSVIREFGKIVKEEIYSEANLSSEESNRINIYDIGNGRLSIIMPNDIQDEKISALKNRIMQRADKEIFEKSILEFTSDTCANVNANRKAEEAEKIIDDFKISLKRVFKLPDDTQDQKLNELLINEIPHPRNLGAIKINDIELELRGEDMKFLTKQITTPISETPKNTLYINNTKRQAIINR
ncbi:MAG: hypothetical protein WCJ33_05390, partial [Pseudomonadota bacterium]